MISMVLTLLALLVGIFFAIVGVVCVIKCFRENDNWISAVFVSFIMSLACIAPSLFTQVQDKVITYEKPTQVIRTNNATVVDYVPGDGEVVHLWSRNTEWWNATNIMVQVENGKNLYGRVCTPSYGIVMR